MNTPSRVDLNIYLFKDGISLSQAVKKNVTQIPLQYGGRNVGTLYVKSTKSNRPRWTRFFGEVVAADVFGKNSSAAALLVMKPAGRVFGLAFGHGRYLLQMEHVENNFGLRVTLNSVDENSLRSIDKASFEEQPKHSREQTGKAAGLPSFVVDVERDLLKAVTGKPTDSIFGERISGMDSVKLSIDIHISSLPQLLERLLKQYSSDNYKTKGFAFVDHVGEVRDAALIDTLDAQLITNIKANRTEKIWLAVPELVDWDRAVGFKYSTAASATRYYDVKLSEFLESVHGRTLDKETLLTRRIYCVDDGDLAVFDKLAYYYVYAEQGHKKQTYVLNNGNWYLIDRDFVSEVNEFYKNVPRYKGALPSFGETDSTEGDYNARVAKESPAEFGLLDKLMIRLPGALAPVEACDLYRKAKQFIHVKRYGGSSLLSHLFNQGTVSAELFKSDVRFRKELNTRLPRQHKITNIEEVPRPNEYKVVYAVISKYEEDLSIPFFSKISLRHAVNRLTTLGYKVELAKVAVSPIKKVLQVVPARHSKKKASAKAIAV